MPISPSTDAEIEAAQAQAIKIITDAKKLLEATGLEVSFITRCADGAKWPVLMLEVGQTYADIKAVRNGKR
jgi:nucleotide-binding universal stress UspA family protein